MMLIAGDIGGTGTRLALIGDDGDAPALLAQESFPSQDHAGLEPIVQAFLARHQASASAACFCVAGPVIAGRAQLTNLPWALDEEALAQNLGMRSVHLINDLQAIGLGIGRLEPGDVVTLNEGRPQRDGVLAVMAPGTGLGEAFLVPAGPGGDGARIACASEGGHADFAPLDQQQAALFSFVARRFGHVSYERVCAGVGLPNVYDFLRDSGAAIENPALAAQLAALEDRTPAIVAAALAARDPDELSFLTLRLVVDIWAAEAGNLALKTLSTAGLYLAGGMPPRVIELMRDGRFMRIFCAKGRLSDLLAAIPVHVVMVNAALIGAADEVWRIGQRG